MQHLSAAKRQCSPLNHSGADTLHFEGDTWSIASNETKRAALAMDTSPLMSVQEASTDISMEEITAELDSYLSGSGHAPSGASRLSTEDLNSASMPETSEAYMADRIWDIATKMVEKSSPLKHPSLMQDPLKVDDALDRIERHVKFSEEAELKTFPIPRKSYRKTPRGRKRPPASYMSPTYNSFQKANETAAERLVPCTRQNEGLITNATRWHWRRSS